MDLTQTTQTWLATYLLRIQYIMLCPWLDYSPGGDEDGMMLSIATIWLLCLGAFLCLAESAPILDSEF